jgi:CheY-like chemotaxis protein
MSKEVVAHAFEPFFTTKPSREGSGLGLATTYGIIAESDGAITLSSEEGIGTTVCIRLPVVDEVVDVTRIVAQSPGGNGETILVVEDEEAMRRVTARILNRNGYHVLEATSCEDALDLVAAHNCDLLLTDVVMPMMSGPDLAEQVHVRHPDVPVLFMSGYSKGVLGGRRVLGDGIALVRKPFDEPTLLEKVQSVLAGVQ